MKKYLVLILILGFFLEYTINEAIAEQLPSALYIGASPMGTATYTGGAALATVINKYTPMRATVKGLAGPSAWFPFTTSKEIELGCLNSWDGEKGYFGESIYAKLSQGKGFPINLIAISIPLKISLIVARDSGIYRFSDLKGKRVSGNFPTIGFQLQTEGFLANGGLKWSDVIPVPVSSIAEGVRAVIEGRSDTSTCGLGIPIVQELHARKGARFLPFDPSPEAVKRMYEKYSGYPFKVTPAPEYIGLEKEQYFWAFDIYFIGHKDLPDEAVYQIVKALWENYKEVGSFDPDLKKEFTPERFVSKEALIPYHPGAIKFYKEKGVWTGEMGKLQEALLAKKK